MKTWALSSRDIEIVEVSPRDGLQNEPEIVATANKIALVEHAIAAGARRIEVASFVNPRRVPQMADAEAVIAGLPARSDVTYVGLVLNARGAERAIATGVDELGAVCVATDGFAVRNQGQTSDESVDSACAIVAMAKAAGRSAQITIGASFGCPFEGEVPQARIVEIARRVAAAGPCDIALADTIGVAVPSAVGSLVEKVRMLVAPVPVRVHLHNTRNTGLANAWAAVQAGAATLDASIGGLGGCPFAPGAAGNIPTEDTIYLLERAGIRTGLSLDRVIEASRWLTEIMGRPLAGMTSRAGPFPNAVVRE
jgi:hydroxymethylglutaryl-CoA lyase